MERIGLVAGGGSLPIEFIRAAKSKGDEVIVFAIQGMASPDLESDADKVYWLNVGQITKFSFLLIRERLRKLAFIGKIDKSIIYKNKNADAEYKKAVKKLKSMEDYSIFDEITKRLGKVGIEVINGTDYLSHLVVGKGVLGEITPDERIEGDMDFGYKAAKKIADMDIGQTVVVKDKTIVAVEAMEGTDRTIKRAASLAGTGCVMVKVSRPRQDLRWDVPTVGIQTMENLSGNRFSALAVESGKMFIVDKEKVINAANSANIAIKAF